MLLITEFVHFLPDLSSKILEYQYVRLKDSYSLIITTIYNDINKLHHFCTSLVNK